MIETKEILFFFRDYNSIFVVIVLDKIKFNYLIFLVCTILFYK